MGNKEILSEFSAWKSDCVQVMTIFTFIIYIVFCSCIVLSRRLTVNALLNDGPVNTIVMIRTRDPPCRRQALRSITATVHSSDKKNSTV